MVAPFLARRIWNGPPFRIALAKCKACGFTFFNPRLESDEEARLYAGYRSSEYQSMRNACEPWYTPAFNEKLTDSSQIETRKAQIAEILRQHIGSSRPIRSILDYGGARGDIVQDLIPGARAYVYDVSRVHPVNGVTACNDLEDCQRVNPDVVLCSNVLEHVGSPQNLVSEIVSVAGPDTAIWIEVPCESPFSWTLRSRRFVQELVLLALRPRLALSMARPGMLNLMHEHVNFFTLASLHALLDSCALATSASGAYYLNATSRKGQMVWALGHKPDVSNSAK